MNNEIKEIRNILFELQFLGNDTQSKVVKLHDYITNLQQENEKIRMRNDMLRKDIDSFIQDNKIDYKSRCEKAIEYIKDFRTEDYILVGKNSLLNILQNGSDKNE